MTPHDVEEWLSSCCSEEVTMNNSHNNGNLNIVNENECNLFAFPAQCNFSGARYPLEWIAKVKNIQSCNGRPWKVLVDIAAYSTTTLMDLAQHPADIAVL